MNTLPIDFDAVLAGEPIGTEDIPEREIITSPKWSAIYGSIQTHTMDLWEKMKAEPSFRPGTEAWDYHFDNILLPSLDQEAQMTLFWSDELRAELEESNPEVFEPQSWDEDFDENIFYWQDLMEENGGDLYKTRGHYAHGYLNHFMMAKIAEGIHHLLAGQRKVVLKHNGGLRLLGIVMPDEYFHSANTFNFPHPNDPTRSV